MGSRVAEHRKIPPSSNAVHQGRVDLGCNLGDDLLLDSIHLFLRRALVHLLTKFVADNDALRLVVLVKNNIALAVLLKEVSGHTGLSSAVNKLGDELVCLALDVVQTTGWGHLLEKGERL